MKNYSPSSGHDIVYLDLSTSSMGVLQFQSSADPVGLASIMPSHLVFYSSPTEVALKPRIPELHPGAIWASEDFDEPLPDEFWIGNE